MAISLKKGQRISLEKSGGNTITQMCVGVNWGAIDKRGCFGNIKKEAVDLDASCITFNTSKQVMDIIYFGKLSCQGITHSGDDLTGDLDGDDGLDNEIIVVNLNQLSPEVDQIVFALNSFQGHDFKTIPFASIRLYEGTPTRVDEVHAIFDIANDPKFAGAVSMVMGKLYKKDGQWKFTAIGDTTRDRQLEQTIQTISQQYV
mgnify:FL=1